MRAKRKARPNGIHIKCRSNKLILEVISMKGKKDRLKRLTALWQAGKISGLEYSQRATQLTQAQSSKTSLPKSIKKRFTKVDRKYNPHPKKTVSGGLPELGKRR